MPHIKPKRWVPICGVGIAVTATIAAAAMTGSCVFDTRTNFCEQFGIRCKEGQECAAHQPVCIDIGGCGNGVVDRDKGEVCDDGNIVDGEMVNGKLVLDDCNHDCTSDQRCGNSIVDVGETCDHGSRNGQPDDSCNDHCQLRDEFCGNGIVDMNMGEQCDPGDTDSAGCNSRRASDPANLFSSPDLKLVGCKFSICGDGYTNTAINPLTMEPVEQCDTGNTITSECNGAPLCTKPVCGDNFHNTEAGEDCDNGKDTSGCNGDNNGSAGPGNCKFPKCGDHYINTAFKPPGSKLIETCDTGSDSQTCNGDGNGSSGNDPDAQCQPPSCGDGYVNGAFTPKGSTLVEKCDNIGGMDTNNCNGNNGGLNGPGSCRKPACGDGYKNTAFTPSGALAKPEQCDTGGNSSTCNGNDNDDDTAKGLGDCQIPSCGDGYTNTKFTPMGSTQTEICDTSGDSQTCNGDGNGDNHNNANAKCQIPQCGDGYVNINFKPPGSILKEACDTGGDSSTCNGNGNGNNKNNNNAKCQPSNCGDGYLNIQAEEECDKGNPPGIPKIDCANSSLTCQSNCKCI